MKRICFLFFFLFSLFVHSQTILSDSVLGVNCYHDGSISLSITNVNSLTLNWYYEDSILGWISADTISAITFLNSDKDSLITTLCGNYKLEFNSIVKIYWVPCRLAFTPSQNNIKCFGDSSGMLKRVAYAGSPPYFYEWFKFGIPYSSGYNDTLFDNLVVGSYKVVITDSIGCSDSISTNVVSPSLLIFDTIYTSDINCRGVNSGSFSCSVSGGKKYLINEIYDYFLINLNTSDTISWIRRDSISLNISSVLNPYQITFDSLFSGEYILSVVDSFGCILDDTFELIEPVPYQTFASTIFPLICESDSGYLEIDSVIGGGNIDFGFAYDTINGVYIDSIYVSSGWYQMYIEDLDFGCIDTVPVRCYAQYEIEVSETIMPVYCFGEATGSVIINSINGGNFPYDVQWGSVNSSSLLAGTYSVNIVDAIGCLHTEVYVISQSDQINPNETLYNPLCYGISNGSITIDLSGGIGSLNYYWLNGTGTADSLYGLSEGLYPLVVSDSLMCLDTFNISLSEPDTLVVSAENYQTLLSCFGALTTVDILIYGGTPPYSILWNDGDTNQQRIVGADSYSVTVTDANGCISADTHIIITEPDSLSISIGHTDISCTDGSVATVMVSGGVAPVSYLWSTGDTTQSIDSLWDATYWIIVTDSCGNSVSDTLELFPYLLEASIYFDDVTHIGLVEIDNSSTGGPFSYEWTDVLDNIISTDSVTSNLCEGTYFVTTTDNISNCSVTDTLLSAYYLPNGIVDESTTTVSEDADLWGASPYTYLWSTGETTQHVNICPGFHWVEVTDKDDCMVRQDFEIEELIISLDPASAIIECNLENLDIDIEASATGGIEPYSFEWWNGSTKNPINLGMSPGDYSLTVIDDNGCIKDTFFVIATMSAECVPNVFTPNGDDVNAIWSLEDTFLYEDSEVRIYGRFGRLVFHSVGYHDPWDGTNKQGNDVPDGVYFYSIEIGHGFDHINGTVTILR